MIKTVIVSAVLLCNLCACTTEFITEKPDTNERLVRVLFAPGGLGDLSYNDDILRGIVQEKQNTDFGLYYLCPKDMESAENIVKTWQQSDAKNQACYTILAGSEYEEAARKNDTGIWRSNLLLFETADSSLSASTFCFRGYGVSFIAGIAAYTLTEADSSVYLGGWQDDAFIKECYQGFTDGYTFAGGKKVAACYLSRNPDGFAMSARAYRMADSLFQLYPFIYSMAGSSNNGVYQYLREHPETRGFTNGVDVDQSAYSDRIIGSMVKNTGDCVAAYIRAWAKGEPAAHHKVYSLTSGYISFKVADRFREQLHHVVENCWDIALQREQKYLEKKQ